MRSRMLAYSEHWRVGGDCHLDVGPGAYMARVATARAVTRWPSASCLRTACSSAFVEGHVQAVCLKFSRAASFVCFLSGSAQSQASTPASG